MEDYKIRLLKASEIECRVGSISEKGVSLLLYKDARADQRILDETFGIFGWKRSHQCINGNLYCTVEILDKETGTWIAKQDVGTSKIENETEKSQASDSFKRACFNWGIGRELYTAPFIWIPADKTDIQPRNGKLYCNDRFSVAKIAYSNERVINSISIINYRNSVVYRIGKDSNNISSSNNSDSNNSSDNNASSNANNNNNTVHSNSNAHSVSSLQMEMLKKELIRTGVRADEVTERYHLDSLENMPSDIYIRAMSVLSRMKSTGVA